MATSAVFWVGCLLIFIYALERFNTPPTNRSSTTWLRYYMAALIYVGLFEVTFAIIARYPELAAYLQGVAPQWRESLADLADVGEGPQSTTVGIALVLSVLVPKIPGLARIDRALRGGLQRAAAIPHEARRFARCIWAADFKPDQLLRDAIDARYEKLGLDATLSVDAIQPAALRLHQLTAMMLTLEDWEKDRRFAGFLAERREQHERLKERYGRAVEMAKGYFELPDQDVGEIGGVLGDAAAKFRKGFREELDNLSMEAAELTSHTLLKCCVRASPRFAELHVMGLWPQEEQSHGVNADQFTLLLGSLVLVLLLYAVLVSEPGQTDKLSLVAKIPIIYILAVIWAVLPKQHWRLFRRQPGAPPPALGYALAGIAAVLSAVCVTLLFRLMLETKGLPFAEALTAAWWDFVDNSVPWLLMVFVTTVATSAVIDAESIAAETPESRRRCVEAAIMAGVVGVASVLVWWLLTGIRAPEDVPPVYAVLLVSAVIGGLIGFMVPHWYRGSPVPVPRHEVVHGA